MRTIEHPIVAAVLSKMKASKQPCAAEVETNRGRLIIGYDPGDRCNRSATVVMRCNDDGSLTVLDERTETES